MKSAMSVPPPPHWLSYIGTADVDATVRQAVELGGKVATPAYDVPGVGRMAVLHDPQGAMFAVSAQVERSRYTDPQLGDFSWHELMTTNWQTAFDFYSKLFGWEKMQAMDMGPQGTYLIYGTGGHQLGGIFAPGGLPPPGAQWLPYILVRDARRTAELVKELGAAVIHGPHGSARRRLGVHRHRSSRRDVRRAFEETRHRSGRAFEVAPYRNHEGHEEKIR